MVKYLLTSQSTERTVPVYELISFTRSVQNRTMATISDLWTEWMVSTSFRARRVLVLNFLENRRRSPARAMVNVANRQSLTTGGGGGGQVRYLASPREICGSQSGNEPGFSPSTSVFPCMQHSTNTPNSSSTTWYPYQKDNGAAQ